MKRFLVATAAVGAAWAIAAAPSVAAGSLPTLTLKLTKHSITVGGAKVSGAVKITTRVSGEPGDNPLLILLKPGVSPQRFGAVVSHLGHKPLDAIDPYGTIVFDGQFAPKGETTIDQAYLPAGTYVALNNANAHAVFSVSRSAHPAALPKPGGTIKAIDFGFRGAKRLHDGELVRFVNDGYLIHMFLWGRMRSLADAKKGEKLLLAGKLNEAGKKYAVGEGEFAGPLSHGSSQQETITEQPGVYVILCAMNAEDGRDHYQLGMFRTIRIVK